MATPPNDQLPVDDHWNLDSAVTDLTARVDATESRLDAIDADDLANRVAALEARLAAHDAVVQIAGNDITIVADKLTIQANTSTQEYVDGLAITQSSPSGVFSLRGETVEITSGPIGVLSLVGEEGVEIRNNGPEGLLVESMGGDLEIRSKGNSNNLLVSAEYDVNIAATHRVEVTADDQVQITGTSKVVINPGAKVELG